MHGARGWIALSLLAGLVLGGCSGKKAFDEAAALEADGDRYAALTAYRAVAETYGGGTWETKANEAIDTMVDGIAQEIFAAGAPDFDLPEGCTLDSAAAETIEAGVKVTLELHCEGRAVSTSGRIIEEGKVWDLTPVEGVLTKEGECVFRSVANPFGDWNIPMPAEECHTERDKRINALARYKQPGGLADFQCDCRVGAATFEVPRGEPMWKTGPKGPTLPPDFMDKQGMMEKPGGVATP